MPQICELITQLHHRNRLGESWWFWLKIFREWDGDLKKLPNIKMRKVSTKNAVCSRTEVANGEAEEELDAAKDTD